MTTYQIFESLLELTQESSGELLKIYHKKSNRKTSLIFPSNREGETRLSEQELRFTLINMIEKFSSPNLFYSVETPTKELYSFSNAGQGTAFSDLSFYDGDKKVLNIELKAKNTDSKLIQKDIEKLIRESIRGGWIHILENEQVNTVGTLFNKFIESFVNLNLDIKYPISFHILIIKTGTLLSRKGKDSDVSNFDVTKIFNIDYSMWKDLDPGKYHFRNGKLIDENSVDINEDWQVDKFDIDNL